MTEARQPNSTPPGRVGRRRERKRRAPLALLLVPIVLVAGGVGLFLALGGDKVPGLPFIGDDKDDEIPAFEFKLSKTQFDTTSEEPDGDALRLAASNLAQELVPILNGLYVEAFLNPGNWRQGEYDTVWELFDAGALTAAREGIETLTIGATAGDVYEELAPTKGSLRFRVLFDADGNAVTVAVKVRFYALGTRQDGTYTAIVSHGQMFLVDTGSGWKITAFDMKRNDRVAEPPVPTPGPSGAPTASPS